MRRLILGQYLKSCSFYFPCAIVPGVHKLGTDLCSARRSAKGWGVGTYGLKLLPVRDRAILNSSGCGLYVSKLAWFIV